MVIQLHYTVELCWNHSQHQWLYTIMMPSANNEYIDTQTQVEIVKMFDKCCCWKWSLPNCGFIVRQVSYEPQNSFPRMNDENMTSVCCSTVKQDAASPLFWLLLRGIHPVMKIPSDTDPEFWIRAPCMKEEHRMEHVIENNNHNLKFRTGKMWQILISSLPLPTHAFSGVREFSMMIHDCWRWFFKTAWVA